ncbi:hypothetical protein [Mesobacterium pallidum]|uniref:hypothetical protein n=1 Tax=Mesobacterium pallidum TaxID=2872037 RepID=UPI001EE243BC|nr:hypothetical protein [Mesobacterium pallidum]
MRLMVSMNRSRERLESRRSGGTKPAEVQRTVDEVNASFAARTLDSDILNFETEPEEEIVSLDSFHDFLQGKVHQLRSKGAMKAMVYYLIEEELLPSSFWEKEASQTSVKIVRRSDISKAKFCKMIMGEYWRAIENRDAESIDISRLLFTRISMKDLELGILAAKLSLSRGNTRTLAAKERNPDSSKKSFYHSSQIAGELHVTGDLSGICYLDAQAQEKVKTLTLFLTFGEDREFNRLLNAEYTTSTDPEKKTLENPGRFIGNKSRYFNVRNRKEIVNSYTTVEQSTAYSRDIGNFLFAGGNQDVVRFHRIDNETNNMKPFKFIEYDQHLDLLKAITQGFDINEQEPVSGNTVLHMIVENGAAYCMQLISRRAEDPVATFELETDADDYGGIENINKAISRVRRELNPLIVNSSGQLPVDLLPPMDFSSKLLPYYADVSAQVMQLQFDECRRRGITLDQFRSMMSGSHDSQGGPVSEF